jgi:hypothetical protein
MWVKACYVQQLNRIEEEKRIEKKCISERGRGSRGAHAET